MKQTLISFFMILFIVAWITASIDLLLLNVSQREMCRMTSQSQEEYKNCIK